MLGLSRRPWLALGTTVAVVGCIAVAAYFLSRQAAYTDGGTGERIDISRAVFADGQLWVLHSDGTLVSLKPNEALPKRAELGGKALEICRSDGQLITLVETGKGAWSVQRRSQSSWKIMASAAVENEWLQALACSSNGEGVSVITNRRLLEVEDERVREVRLNPELKSFGTALIADDAVWVGFNDGEWGGGLRRINRSDGTVQIIESNHSGALCGGPLNTECDPVNALVASPSKPGCVVVAIGLVHISSHGRIVEVCGTNVRRLYFKPLGPQPAVQKASEEDDILNTVPFFGLARSGDTVWAVGADGIYSFTGLARPEFRSLPRFEKRGRYRVNFQMPDVILVMTDINQRNAMSGVVPIMAAR